MKLPWTKRLLLASGLVFGLAVCFAGPRGLPPTEGITNFGRVNEFLFRGAQPDTAAIENLKRLGVKSIINLRVPKEASTNEEAHAHATGIVYTNVPLAGMGRPTDEQVAKILSLIDTLPKPVFVHCKHGCDRTGTVVACYRIAHDHWTTADALNEAGTYGMSGLERGMREYIVNFAKAMNANTNQPSVAKR
ncbi:MAG TPA: tyrosine-protein phosphatase [Verrucomicrobiae bacterium]|nr:tyrosine-protein phosphatase [Verrucomicrobiae bacterium]